MKGVNFQEVLYFLFGFACGFIILTLFLQSYQALIAHQHINSGSLKHESYDTSVNRQKYDQELADMLFNEIKILCWIFTHPDNHKTKLPHLKNTWGKKCNKLLFMSIKNDSSIPEIVVIPVENGRDHLWNKTKLTMEYVYKNHLNDADWFMRADDDK